MKNKKIPEEQKNPRKRMYTKPKAGNSFSISKRRNSCTTMARQHPSQEKTWRKETAFHTDESSSTSTNTKASTSVVGEDESETTEIAIASSMDDDEWETETSIEIMRSAELTSVNESVIPPPESFRDIASLVFLSESYCPIASSTPRFISDGKSFPFSVNIDSLKEAVPHASPILKSDVVIRHEELPNVSFENEFAKEKDTLEDEDFQLKPITPEKNLVLPDIADDIIQETREQREGEDTEMKSISPEQSVQLPVVPDNVSYRNKEQSEGRLGSNETEDLMLSPFKKRDDGECRGRLGSNETEDLMLSPFKKRDDGECSDSFIFPEVILSAGSDISQDSDASTVPYLKEDQILSPVKNHDDAEHRDSIADLEIPYSGGSDISQDSDASTVRNFGQDQKYSENSPLEAVVNKSTNSNSRKRKQGEAGNLFEDNDDSSNGENFGKFRNLKIDSSKEKLKGYKVKNRMNESITRWLQRNEGVNFLEYKSDSEDNIENVQKIQTTDSEGNELFNNQPQTAAPQIKIILSRSKKSNQKRKDVNKIVSSSEDVDDYNRIDNFETNETPKTKGRLCKRSKLKFSKRIKTPRRRKYRNEGGNLFKDVGMNDSGGIFETDQNEQNELQDVELDNKRPETSTYRTNRKINKYVGADNTTQKDANIINRSQSSPSLKKKYKKYKNEEENCFEDMDMNVSEDNFEHFQNEPREELRQDDESDYNVPEISAHQIKRKNNIHVGSDNMKQQNASTSNKSPSSVHRRRRHENEGENSFGDLDKRDNVKSSENIQENRNDGEKVGNSFEEAHDGVDDFEEVHNMEANTSKKKRKPYRSVGIKRNRRVNRSRKAANSLNRSRNSTSREVSVGPQNRINEAENTNWPRCCMEASSVFRRTFRVLSPVFHDDCPIDSITLLSYDVMGSKKTCKH